MPQKLALNDELIAALEDGLCAAGLTKPMDPFEAICGLLIITLRHHTPAGERGAIFDFMSKAVREAIELAKDEPPDGSKLYH